jgi:hypothetical protein
MKTRLLTAFLVVSCVSTLAAETYEIERWAVGAVGLGWAGFGAALAGPTEYMINPAGLADAEWPNIAANYFSQMEVYYDENVEKNRTRENIYCFGLSYIKPMRSESATLSKEVTIGTLAVSLHQLFYSDKHYERIYFQNYNNDYSESLAIISFGSRVSGNFAYGLNIKALSVESIDYADNGFGLDLGVQFSTGMFYAGFSVNNAIPPGISLNNNNRLYDDRTLRFGIGLTDIKEVTHSISQSVIKPSVGLDIRYQPSITDFNCGIYGEIKTQNVDGTLGMKFGGSISIFEKVASLYGSLFSNVVEIQLCIGGTLAPEKDEPDLINSCFSFIFIPDF